MTKREALQNLQAGTSMKVHVLDQWVVLSPGLTKFVRGFQYGAGVALGFFILASLCIAIVMEALYG